MVIPRGVNTNLLEVSRSKSLDILKRVGRNDIILSHNIEIKNTNGQVISVTSSTSTILGDLQFVTVEDRPLLDLGIAKIGDGILYTTYDIIIDPRDNIVVDGIEWEIKSQVEGETLGTALTYQAFLCGRRP